MDAPIGSIKDARVLAVQTIARFLSTEAVLRLFCIAMRA